jgi:hypothetical protein
MSNVLQEIRERVHGYWSGAPVPANENPKHRIVRETCDLAKAKGLTEADLDDWARLQHGEPSVAVVNATRLQELQARLQRPDGPERFLRRLDRQRRRAAR